MRELEAWRCTLYHSCLFCTRDLGQNRVLESMPIGRRVAFDVANGRLWVICCACVKWNLVPFESRLETIDCCERLFRATRTRYSTDNIGLARHPEGFELIRIGPALRPEYAAWRYGHALRARRRASAGLQSDAIGMLNWVLTTLSDGPLGSLSLSDVTSGAMRALRQHRLLRDPWTDTLVQVPYAALMQATLIAEGRGGWRLEVPYRTGVERTLWVDGAVLPSIRDVPTLGLFAGLALLPALGWLLPALEAGATSLPQVSEAVRLIETAGSHDRLLEYVAGLPLRFATQREYPLREVPVELRLAIEMVAHEDTERRAMEGELKLLERQWSDADAVAAIADRLAFGEG